MKMFDEERRVQWRSGRSTMGFEVLGVHGMTLVTEIYVFYVGIQFLPSGRPQTNVTDRSDDAINVLFTYVSSYEALSHIVQQV